MGETIRKTAAAADIIADLGDAYLKAAAKQGKWQTLAEQQIAPTVKLVENVCAQLDTARKTALPLVLALDATREKAGKVVGKVSDDIWNAVGRPRHDAAFEILFPGGFAFYTDGDVEDLPDRMDLLVELLNSGLHPNLPANVAGDAAATIKVEAQALRGAVQAASGPKTRVVLLERVSLALARSAALALAGYKRVLKAAGFSEAEIHTVIPDRSKPAQKKSPEPAAKPAPAPQQAPSTPATPPAVTAPPTQSAAPTEPAPPA